MKETLEEVLEDERRQARVLADNGHENDAKLIERVCKRVAAAADEYLNFMNETNASLRTGHSVVWLRARFPEMAARGQAKKVGAVRFYREMALEPRKDLGAARAAGRRAAEGSAAPGGRRKSSPGG